VEVVFSKTASWLCSQAAPCVLRLTKQGHQFFLVSFDDFGGARICSSILENSIVFVQSSIVILEFQFDFDTGI